MCIVGIAYRVLPGIRVLLVSNRDEFWNRPTESAHFWKDAPGIFAGRDALSGGTWLGVQSSSRVAFLTNVRNLRLPKKIDPPSRGLLVADFLRGTESPSDYVRGIKSRKHEFEGFNLFCMDASEAIITGNKGTETRQLEPGFFTVSNASWDEPWPKTHKLKQKIQSILQGMAEGWKPEEALAWEERFLMVLSDSEMESNPALLPDTGLGQEREKILSSIRIQSPDYGTRCSNVVTVWDSVDIRMVERSYLNPLSSATRDSSAAFR